MTAMFDLKIALLFFPFIAFLVAIPFILHEYHKYGSISFFKSLLTYSFVLYLICAYFLIILPLPKISEVELMTSPQIQLIPFSFIIDAVPHFNLSLSFLKSSYIYVPLFNILLTIPFGIYLRYYFKLNLKKTCLYTFLLSLFFELTQLSGLYFIYPRGYRLCDIDDLILNTLGGLLGYLIAGCFTKVLPKMDTVQNKQLLKGTEITGFKRTTSLILDLFIYTLLIIIGRFNNTAKIPLIIFIIYYLLIPLITKGSTIGQKWLNLKIVDYQNNFNPLKYILRIIMFILIYFISPIILFKLAFNSSNILMFISFIILIIYFIYIFKTIIRFLFSSKEMTYEKISKTKMISTIKKVNNS